MEDERNTQFHQGGEAVEKADDQVEVKDRGLFDSLLGKKKEEEKKQEEALTTGMEKVSVAEPEVKKEEHEAGQRKESLLSKLHRSSSSSSSSSDEEEEVIDENGQVVKRKKKGLKEKIKEKLPGHKYQEGGHKTAAPAPAPAPVVTHGGHHDTAVAVEKIEGDVKTQLPPAPEEEKKGLLDKTKEKLSGGYKKPEECAAAPAAPAAPAPAPATEEVSSPDAKEKKGILGKIMEKLPGYHKGAGKEDKTAATAPAGEHKTSS